MDQLWGCLHNLTVSKRARLSRIAEGCFSNPRAQVDRAVLWHTNIRLRHLRSHTTSCIPDSLSVSKLLQGRTQEDINETTLLYELQRPKTEYFTRINCHKMQQNIQSCTHQGVRCLITKNEAQVLCVERDRAWLSERLRHLTARWLQFCFQSGPRCVQPGTWRTSVDALRQTPAARLDADSNTCCFY